MPVKGNQPHLLEAIRLWFEVPPQQRGLDFRRWQEVNKGHGRLEKRTLTASIELNSYLDFPGVQQVLKWERQVTHLVSGKVSHEVRYGITSLSPQQAKVQTLARLWRDHWAIENGLHRARDVQFGEDASRVHSGNAPQVLAVCRNAVIGLLRVFGYTSIVQAREHFALHPFHALGLLQLPVSFRFE